MLKITNTLNGIILKRLLYSILFLCFTLLALKSYANNPKGIISIFGVNDTIRNQGENSAINLVPGFEKVFYDWMSRHNEILRTKDSINPEIILIGNSITHWWGNSETKLASADGKERKPRGTKAWNYVFGIHRVLNLGYGWDRTQNILWRLNHGEIDGLHPKLVIIHAGTNNTSKTKNARMNTALEIAEGVEEICKEVHMKVPEAKIVLMAIMQREHLPDHPRRLLINETNQLLKLYAKKQKIDFVDIGPKMLDHKGELLKDITLDSCHPTDKGYQIWAESIKPYINKIEE